MKSTIQDKAKLVNSVFSEVYNKYDFMNDVMSLGIHRIWKDKFIDWMNPSNDSSLIDVASGTGDIAKLFSLRNKNLSKVTCIEPNEHMFKEGKKILRILRISNGLSLLLKIYLLMIIFTTFIQLAMAYEMFLILIKLSRKLTEF